MDNQRARNQLIGGNVFVNITDYFRVGVDVWSVSTDYAQAASDNDIFIVTIGANYYIIRHRAKLVADVMWVGSDMPTSETVRKMRLSQALRLRPV